MNIDQFRKAAEESEDASGDACFYFSPGMPNGETETNVLLTLNPSEATALGLRLLTLAAGRTDGDGEDPIQVYLGIGGGRWSNDESGDCPACGADKSPDSRPERD